MSNKKDIKKFLNKISLKAASDENLPGEGDIVGYIKFSFKPIFNENLELDPNAEFNPLSEENTVILSQVVTKLDNLMQEGVEDRDIVSSLSDEEIDSIDDFFNRFIMADISTSTTELVGYSLEDNSNPQPQQIQGQAIPTWTATTGCAGCLSHRKIHLLIRSVLLKPENVGLLRCVLEKANRNLPRQGRTWINPIGVSCLKLILEWVLQNPGVPPNSSTGMVRQCFIALEDLFKDMLGQLTGRYTSYRGLTIRVIMIPPPTYESPVPKFCIIQLVCDGVNNTVVIPCRNTDTVGRIPVLEPVRVLRPGDTKNFIDALKRRLRQIEININTPPTPLSGLDDCVLAMPMCSVEVAEAIAAGATTVGLCLAAGLLAVGAGAGVAAVAAVTAVCGVATADGNIGDIDEQGNVIAPLEWIQEQCNLLQDLQGPGDDLDLSVCEREYLCDINPDCCGPITSPECIDLIPMAEENCQDGGEGPGMG